MRAIARRRQELTGLPDDRLKSAARGLHRDADAIETFALAAVIAARVLGLQMFDVQILGALAMHRGQIAEMQTGEGKTLAAVPAAIWYARQGRGTHVLTANDYLARRDAAWMRGIYDWFGLSVGHISQDMPAADRRAAYRCDLTYATANEVGFDYLRTAWRAGRTSWYSGSLHLPSSMRPTPSCSTRRASRWSSRAAWPRMPRWHTASIP